MMKIMKTKKNNKLALCILSACMGCCVFMTVGCSHSTQDRTQLKEEIKREILAELGRNQPSPQASDQLERKQMKEEIEREILAKIQEQDQILAHAKPNQNARATPTSVTVWGSAEGLILHKGNGLSGCRVKLVRLAKSDSIIDLFSAYREGAEFESVTDAEGKYRFEKIPVGYYKIKWQLPDEKGWIRRLRDKPDAVIAEGETAVLNSVETSRRLVGQ